MLKSLGIDSTHPHVIQLVNQDTAEREDVCNTSHQSMPSRSVTGNNISNNVSVRRPLSAFAGNSNSLSTINVNIPPKIVEDIRSRKHLIGKNNTSTRSTSSNFYDEASYVELSNEDNVVCDGCNEMGHKQQDCPHASCDMEYFKGDDDSMST
jgi:hypothetical protein